MTLYEWMADHDCELNRSVPGKSTQDPARHFVRYVGGPMKDCRLDPVDLIDGANGLRDAVYVENHPAHWPYENMPRYWRERTFPDHFTHWTEAEHKAKPQPYSWDDQQIIWEHRDAWEAWIDGEMSLDATREYIASLPPLPNLITTQALADSKRVSRNIRAERRTETLTPEQESALVDMLPKIPEPTL